MSSADWWALFAHFLAMSMLAVGGAVAVAPEIHRYVVEQRGWIDDTQFSAAIALAQASPGPNLLFVPVVGHAIAGLPGALVALAGILIPSTTLALTASRWGQKRRETRGVRAFVAGMAPVTIGLLLSAGTVLTAPLARQPVALLLVGVTVLLSAKTRIGPVWLIAAGAAVGAAGWV
ncbi:MAG: chromate transporter [Aquincola sp.]|nr:chromate transporter [Aquincola sp.]MDH4287393.1 chromate transporter [Aquincola sp.]